MNTRKMSCQGCTTTGNAVFEGDRYAGWVCRNCGHRVSGSKAEMLEILRQYSDSPETTALQAVILMDAEIKRLRAAATPQQATLPASEPVANRWNEPGVQTVHAQICCHGPLNEVGILPLSLKIIDALKSRGWLYTRAQPQALRASEPVADWGATVRHLVSLNLDDFLVEAERILAARAQPQADAAEPVATQSEDARDVIGKALSDYMTENSEAGVFSTDPFDSREIDALADAVLAAQAPGARGEQA